MAAVRVADLVLTPSCCTFFSMLSGECTASGSATRVFGGGTVCVTLGVGTVFVKFAFYTLSSSSLFP